MSGRINVSHYGCFLHAKLHTQPNDKKRGYMAASIAIIIVMFIINAFMVYALVRTWERVNEKMEKYFLVKTADFASNERKIAKEKDLGTVDSKNKVIIQTNNLYHPDQTIDKSSYKNPNFKDDYKTVKESMDFSKKEVVSAIVNKKEVESEDNTAYELSVMFNFETIYELSTLDSSKQLEVLSSSFNNRQKELLHQYLLAHQEPFNSINFFDFINQSAKKQDPSFYVKTGWKNEKFEDLNDKVVTVHDEQITEGVKIVHKDKLYDYSI